jgi:hypothetical protein
MLPPKTYSMKPIRVRATAGGSVEVIQDGSTIRPIADPRVTQSDQSLSFDWTGDSAPHWFRVNLSDDGGKLLLVGNPIYINFPENDHP